MAAAEAWEVAKRAIEAYTGLSPATFFTVLAVAVAFYYAVAGFLGPPHPPPLSPRTREAEPLLPPVQLGEVTEEELRAYDGSDPKKPLLMAIKSQIYDVTQSRVFYGPNGPYALFAGKDASRALAKMSFEPKDLTGDISGLGPFELEALQDWEYKFMGKYVKVGTIKKTVPVTEGSDGTQTTDSLDRQVGCSAETGAESKEDAASGHGDEAEQAELKKGSSGPEGDAASGHGDEAEQAELKKGSSGPEGGADHRAEVKEVGASEVTKK